MGNVGLKKAISKLTYAPRKDSTAVARKNS